MSFSTDYLNIGIVKTLRLPANGTVCPRCGFEYVMDVMKYVYNGQGISGTVQ